MPLYDSTSITLHLKTHSIPKFRFQKILDENSTIFAHEINKLQHQILEALHIKIQKPRINRYNLENSDNVLKCFYLSIFFLIIYISWYYLSVLGFFLFSSISVLYMQATPDDGQ